MIRVDNIARSKIVVITPIFGTTARAHSVFVETASLAESATANNSKLKASPEKANLLMLNMKSRTLVRRINREAFEGAIRCAVISVEKSPKQTARIV